jgi:3'-phosphoadenosine 5'-phosphosulfate sulfotransferase (PAPS reductase)/FAD synthetase
MKKQPSKQYEKKTGRRPFVGMMAIDSKQRQEGYERTGCNAYEIGRPMSMPLAFWMESDIWEYIRTKDIQYSSIYDMGYDRTGCVFCAFGAHMEGDCNRFQRMKKTHPKLHTYCMDKLGMKEVLDFCHIPTEPGPEQLELDLE